MKTETDTAATIRSNLCREIRSYCFRAFDVKRAQSSVPFGQLVQATARIKAIVDFAFSCRAIDADTCCETMRRIGDISAFAFRLRGARTEAARKTNTLALEVSVNGLHEIAFTIDQ